jgi:hypothetical protein
MVPSQFDKRRKRRNRPIWVTPEPLKAYLNSIPNIAFSPQVSCWGTSALVHENLTNRFSET